MATYLRGCDRDVRNSAVVSGSLFEMTPEMGTLTDPGNDIIVSSSKTFMKR